MSTFEKFNQGKLAGAEKKFESIAWTRHPVFQGVELKHMITSEDTDGRFSYHLVRIAPGCSIGQHMHETQLETHEVIAGSGECINDGTTSCYEPGVIAILEAGKNHQVHAGSEGLYMFAKFIPALC